MSTAVINSDRSASNDAIEHYLEIERQDLNRQFLHIIFDEDEIVDNYERTKCISPTNLNYWRKKLSDLRAELLAR
jgi:hypothetical protein